MKRLFCVFFSLVMCIFVVAYAHLDARAAGAWSTVPLENQYQYIDSKGDITSPNDVSGVYQGTDNITFAAEAPIATIYINEAMVDRTAAAQVLDPATLENDYLKVTKLWESNPDAGVLKNYLMIGNTGDYTGFKPDIKPGRNYLMFDQTAARLAGNGLSKEADNYIQGDIVSYTFKGAAEYAGEKADVVITYSDLHIVLQKNIVDYDELDKFLVCSGNDVRTNATAGTTDKQQRYGIRVNAKVQVIQNGQVVDGIFYFKSADIDVSRNKEGKPGSGPYAGLTIDTFGALYDAENNMNYSEQVRLNGGWTDGTYKVYLPGGTMDGVAGPGGAANGIAGYKSVIEKTPEGYLFKPQNPEAKDNQDSIYTGFLSAIDNKQGASVTVWSSAAGGDTSVATFLLAGNAGGTTTGVWYNLKSTTHTPDGGNGGNIQTTAWGNRGSTPGALNDGGTVLGPTTLTVSGGRTVTYTMTPNTAAGYELKSLTVNNGKVEYTAPGSYDVDCNSLPFDQASTLNGKEQKLHCDVVKDTNGEVLYYVFTFEGIQQDHAIHVEWQKKHYETYEFQMDDGTAPPAEVSALLPDRATPGNEKRFWVNEQIAPAAPKELSKIVNIGGQNYKYTFLRYKDDYPNPYTYTELHTDEYYTKDAGGAAAPRTTIAQNIHFTGYWTKAPAYTEDYAYKYYEEDGTTPVDVSAIPDDVKKTIPTRGDWYGDGESVYPAMPAVTTYRDTNFAYRFRGWMNPGESVSYDAENPATIQGADVHFLGIWERVSLPVFVSTYIYDESESGPLPPEVLKTIPYDPEDYDDGDTVNAKNPPIIRVTVGSDVWVFQGWDKVSQDIEGSDVRFVGKWIREQNTNPPASGGGGGTTPDPVTYPGGGGIPSATPLSLTSPAEEEQVMLTQGDHLSPPTGDPSPVAPLLFVMGGTAATGITAWMKRRAIRRGRR